jgi:predicted nuclease of predicted toxin-antitoxin system
MKFLIDRTLSPEWAELLAESGFDAAQWSSLLPAGATADEVLDYAAKNGWAVLTGMQDGDAVTSHEHEGSPVVVRIEAPDLSASVIGMDVIAALDELEADPPSGGVTRVRPA